MKLCKFVTVIFVFQHCLQICLGSCPEIQAPQSGMVIFSEMIQSDDNYPLLTLAMYSCINGFILTDGDARRVCLHDGSWSGDAPICAAESELLRFRLLEALCIPMIVCACIRNAILVKL